MGSDLVRISWRCVINAPRNHQYLIHSCVDGDNETQRQINHSHEQYTPFVWEPGHSFIKFVIKDTIELVRTFS